jgi:hypothetical protein
VRPRLFTTASLLSLLLCAASAVLWARSYRIGDAYDCNTHDRVVIGSADGRLFCEHLRADGGVTFVRGYHAYPPPTLRTKTPPNWSFAGFEWTDYKRVDPSGYSVKFEDVRVPDWSLVLVSAALPAWWLVRVSRRGKSKVCRSCGYDLRASPDRCPECGTPVPHNRQMSA